MQSTTQPKLAPGYAETSTRRRPVNPETVIVSDDDVKQCRFVGEAMIDGRLGWMAFRHPKTRRYFFQFRPW
jgi:hypothetical protein